MTRNGERIVMMVVVLMVLAAAIVVRADTTGCTLKCIVYCTFTRVPLCASDCIKKKCKTATVKDALSGCTLDCANSMCTTYISDEAKLEGCVNSCSKNCDA